MSSKLIKQVLTKCKKEPSFIYELIEALETELNMAIPTWCTEDVGSIADYLTMEDKIEVINKARRYHDCNVGINWEVLQVYVDDVAEDESDLTDDEE